MVTSVISYATNCPPYKIEFHKSSSDRCFIFKIFIVWKKKFWFYVDLDLNIICWTRKIYLTNLCCFKFLACYNLSMKTFARIFFMVSICCSLYLLETEILFIFYLTLTFFIWYILTVATTQVIIPFLTFPYLIFILNFHSNQYLPITETFWNSLFFLMFLCLISFSSFVFLFCFRFLT